MIIGGLIKKNGNKSMTHLPKKLQQKIETRKASHSLRQLGMSNNLVDFSSNDYLGFSKCESIFNTTHDFLIQNKITGNGATGSRLLSGNHPLYDRVETLLCNFHNCASALIFNSGYNANLGFFSCIPQRGDVILYDEYSHASIRDGISLSHAKAFKFKHNDLGHLKTLLKRSKIYDTIYVVTESVFSMDGDTPDLQTLTTLCKTYNAHLVIDEAHALGVFGDKGCGLIQDLHLEDVVFARIVTFGKGLGCHGAAVLGSNDLKTYLLNFSRSFIYTTGLAPHALATIYTTYKALLNTQNQETLHNNIQHFNHTIKNLRLNTITNLEQQQGFIPSDSAIHCCIIPGNETVKTMAQNIQKEGFDVKPIMSPTVSKGQERLRFCLHSYNSKKEITEVLQLLANYIR